MTIELGAAAQQFLYRARARTCFTFGGYVAPLVINQLLQSGCVERVWPDDPQYAPGTFRFTAKGAAVSRRLPHHYTIIPGPNDTRIAQCICGYKSPPNTEARAIHSGRVHLNARKVQA